MCQNSTYIINFVIIKKHYKLFVTKMLFCVRHGERGDLCNDPNEFSKLQFIIV